MSDNLEERIFVRVGEPEQEVEQEPQITMKAVARRTLDGNIAIFDHPYVDIIVIPEKSKVLVLAADELSDDVYDVQHRMFEFLRKKGAINPESIKGGNVYGSMEAKYASKGAQGENPSQVIIFNITKWLEEDKEMYEYIERYQDEEMEDLLEPNEENSTDYDYAKSTHKDQKGHIPKQQMYPFASYQTIQEQLSKK